MWSEEHCELPRLLVEWNLMISFVRVEPPLTCWKISDFLPWSSLRVGRSDGMGVETEEIDANSDFIGPLLRHDGVEPIV